MQHAGTTREASLHGPPLQPDPARPSPSRHWASAGRPPPPRTPRPVPGPARRGRGRRAGRRWHLHNGGWSLQRLSAGDRQLDARLRRLGRRAAGAHGFKCGARGGHAPFREPRLLPSPASFLKPRVPGGARARAPAAAQSSRSCRRLLRAREPRSPPRFCTEAAASTRPGRKSRCALLWPGFRAWQASRLPRRCFWVLSSLPSLLPRVSLTSTLSLKAFRP